MEVENQESSIHRHNLQIQGAVVSDERGYEKV
jgi:hypothetical protein